MSGAVDWHVVQQLIEASDYEGLVALTGELDAAARKALTPRLKNYARRPPGDWEWQINDAAASLAGALLMPNASSVVSWLLSHPPAGYLQSPHGAHRIDVSDQVGDVLISRGDEWLPTIVAGLGARLRFEHWGGPLPLLTLIERLRSHVRAAPPQGAGYLAQWATSLTSVEEVRSQLTAEPRFVPIIPLLFSIDDFARQLGSWSAWPAWIATLASDGSIDRDDVLDAVLTRLQRPGKPGILRGVLSVLTALDVTTDEVAGRVQDYLALLSADQSTVAGHAQTQLLALDDRSGLSPEQLNDLSQATLTRSEKRIVRAQLVHLRRATERRSDEAAIWVGSVALALAHPATDVQSDAIEFLATVADRLDADARAEVLDRGSLLPRDLAERLAVALGLTAESAPSIPSPAGADSQPAAALHPLESPAELAEVLLRVMHARTGPDPGQVEQVLEGLVRFSATIDRAELRTALHPVVQDDWYQWQLRPETDEQDFSPDSAHLVSSLLFLTAAALGDPVREDADVLHEHGHRGPAVTMLSRIHALTADVRAGSVDRLVSFPESADGRIESHELARRLSVARRDHARLSSTDIDAALVRVAPEDNATLRDELALINRHPVDHLPVRFELYELVGSYIHWDGQRLENRLLTVRPTSDNPAPDATAPGARLDPRTRDTSTERCYAWYEVNQSCWPLIAPHHRELLASWFLETGAASAATLPALAACAGDMGPALALVIAQALGAAEAAAQANAVDALLLLSARNELNDHVLGKVLVTLLRRGELKLARLVAPLRDASFAGIPQHVWPLISSVLEHAISGQPIPPGTPDLMALATELVPTVRPTVPVAGIDDLADRKGRTRQIVEARRLRDALSANSTS